MININLSIQALHQKALFTAKEYLRCESELIDILQALDRSKAYLHFAMPSLFAYSTKLLKLSDHVALTLIGIARKSVLIPELKAAIRQNIITVSNARRIVPVLNTQNKNEWIKKAACLTQSKLEIELAKSFPQQVFTPTKIKYKTQSKVRFEVDLEVTTIGKLKRVQDILSQKKKLHIDEAQALDIMLDEYIEKHDPLKKAKKAEKKKQTKEKTNTSFQKQGLEKTNAISPKEVLPEVRSQLHSIGVKEEKNHQFPFVLRRTPLKAELKHAVTLRDRDQCTHRYPDGSRCNEKKWLHVHHIQEVSRGGTNDLTNLLTLCSQHHRLLHYLHEKNVV